MILRATGLALLALAAASGCGKREVSQTAAPPVPPNAKAAAESGDTNKPGAVDLALAPISTFEAACARCHGPQGSFYGENFASSLTPEALRQTVEEMMLGPGGLQPAPAEIDAMTAYHLALRRKLPFAVVTNGGSLASGQAPTVRGEKTPEVTIEVVNAGSARPAEGDELAWEAPAPPGPFEIRLRSGERTWSFTWPEKLWSADYPEQKTAAPASE